MFFLGEFNKENVKISSLLEFSIRKKLKQNIINILKTQY
jgi:hypothetical protein